MESKYVVFDKFHAVVVPQGCKHSEVELKFKEPTSAGFFRVYVDDSGLMDIAVFGESESLGLSSVETDARLLKMILSIKRG